MNAMEIRGLRKVYKDVTAVVGLPEMDDHYELIATAKTPDFWYDEVYLYRRKGLRNS